MPAPPPRTAVLVGFSLLLMSFVSGWMDILSYRQLGEVFTSAMTGNAALLGWELGRGDFPATIRNLAALAGFLVGVGLGETILRRRRTEPGWSRVVTWVVLVEEGLLVGFAALWHFGAGASSDRLRYGLIVLSALAMGTQSAAARSVGVPGVTTTYFTGTLTSIVARALGGAPACAPAPSLSGIRWPSFAFLAYIGGAAVAGLLQRTPGALLTAAPAIGLPALPAAVVALVLLLAFLDHRIRRGQRRGSTGAS